MRAVQAVKKRSEQNCCFPNKKGDKPSMQILDQRDKYILQFIFLISQLGIFLEWFGRPKINTYCGIGTIFCGNLFYIAVFMLYEYFLWKKDFPLTKFILICNLLHIALLIVALISIAIWFQMYRFFCWDGPFSMDFILPGFYCYLSLLIVSCLAHNLYVQRKKR